MADLKKLRDMVTELDKLVSSNPVVKERMRVIEKRAKQEEAWQETDWAYEADMQVRMRHAN